MTIKIIKSSKWRRKKERKKDLPPQGLKYDTAKSRERKRKKGKQDSRKRKGREREKEREEKLFSPIVKIRRTKKEKERIRQSVKKKGDERKVKWKKKKKWKKRRKNSEMNCLFFSMIFLSLPLSSLKEGGVTWWLTETRRWEWYSPPVELKLSSSQKVTVRNECGSHRCSHLSDLGSPDIGRGKRKWSQMIGGGTPNGSGVPFPSTEVNTKKGKFLGKSRGRRTIAILLRAKDKKTETRRTPKSFKPALKKKQYKVY